MSYHLRAVHHALKTVQLSGEPVRIMPVYEVHLPIGVTLDGLAGKYGLVTRPDRRQGGVWVERPPLTRAQMAA